MNRTGNRAAASDTGATTNDRVRVSCDSLVALGSRTAGGRTIFAKNSDRPAAECQPMFWSDRRRSPEGSRLRCQYIEIDDVAETYALAGARPAWLWGLEHGVNEHGVAIGNHTIFTRDVPAETGLLGMDLVRLGLERAATAEAAANVIIELVERYGQGGSGYSDTHWPYHNSFLVADARDAWLLEASASRWALRRAHDGVLAASNHTTIGEDWDRVGHDTIEHAIALDWWPEPTGVRFDFARAYRSTEIVPPIVSSGRYRTTCESLAATGLDVASFQRILRDHYEGGDVHVPGRAPDDEKYFSVCMHADPVGTTTASMVVELGDSRPVLAWMSLTNPCVAPFLPVFVGAPLPEELCRGTLDPASGGAWHRFKALVSEVEKDFATRAPLVRAFWREHEKEIARETREAVSAFPRAEHERRAAGAELMARMWERTSTALDEITGRVRAL